MTTGQKIGILAKKKKINLHKLADSAGVSYNTLYSIVRRKSDKVDIDTIRKIALALDVHPIEIYGDESLGLIEYGMDLLERGMTAAENVTTKQPSFDFYFNDLNHKENKIFNDLAADYRKLSIDGMREAARSVKIIAGNPMYQRTDTAEQAETPPAPLAEDEQGKSSTEQEKPPAGQNDPIDGK